MERPLLPVTGNGSRSQLLLDRVARSPLLFLLILSFSFSTSGQAATERVDPKQEEYCRNFTVGNPKANEFYSPLYPNPYPAQLTCYRVITADIGYFVRIDFRDTFRLEPKSTQEKCEYDYLEIRDGDQGYAPLIGKNKNQSRQLTRALALIRELGLFIHRGLS